MNRVLYSSLVLLLLLLACSWKNTKISSDNFGELWGEIIAKLNKNSGQKLGNLSHLTTDLLLLNEQELSQINSLWLNSAHEGLNKEELRKKENKFFYDHIEKLNNQVILQLEEIGKQNKSTKNYRDLADRISVAIEKNPIISSENARTFEHGDEIGFCFGRALLAHYLLLKNGVPESDILKIFTIGQLKVGYQYWHFHVAVMVKDPLSGFIVLDPLQEKTLDYKDWIAANHRYSVKYPLSRVRFYVTDPRKFMPANGMYAVEDLSHPVLKEYFFKLGFEIKNNFALINSHCGG
jgi:hypothetical protein